MKIQFIAYFDDGHSNYSGKVGAGGWVKLDWDDTQYPKVAQLVGLFHGKRMKVTIEEDKA